MGAVVHFEVPYDDRERATTFYSDVFGWDVRPMGEMAYDTVQTGETDEQGMPTAPGYIGGGMLQREEPVDRPVIVLDVDDMEDSLRRLEEAGGKVVHGPDPIGDMGFAAYFSDTEGNVVGLWQTARSD